MEIILLIVSLVILFVLGFIAWRLVRNQKGGDEQSLVLLQNQLNELSRTLDERMGKSQTEIRESLTAQMNASQRIMKDMSEELVKVQKELGEAASASKQVLDISKSLESLQKILTNQKQRGSLGEAGLELILSNLLPPEVYECQYGFSSGEIVDAIIKTKDGYICIDAKFSLDNYNRMVSEEDAEKRSILEREFKNDLKKRIDETAKYIRPKDGTLPFAIMYIPAEGIYYDLLVNSVGSSVNSRNLIDYALKDKKVLIVSPTTLFAYLHTILQGFRAFQIEKQAIHIQKNVENLMRHLKRYDEYHDKLGKSLSTTVNHYNASRRELGKVDKDVLRITGSSAELTTDLIDGPQAESEERI